MSRSVAGNLQGAAGQIWCFHGKLYNNTNLIPYVCNAFLFPFHRSVRLFDNA